MAQAPTLSVEGGKIKGVNTSCKDVVVYKGIPYAAPPVGDLRWKKPQAVKPWKGVRMCDKFGAAFVGSGNVGIIVTGLSFIRENLPNIAKTVYT